MPKRATSIRLTDEARALMKLLAGKLGISEAAVMEIAIRELAEKQAVRQ